MPAMGSNQKPQNLFDPLPEGIAKALFERIDINMCLHGQGQGPFLWFIDGCVDR